MNACHATLHKMNFKNFLQNAAVLTSSKFLHNAALQTKTHPRRQASSLCCILLTIQFPTRYLPHFPRFYLVSSLSYSRRKSGHSLVTFRKVNFPIPPRNYACHCTSLPLFRLSLFSLLIFKRLKIPFSFICVMADTSALYGRQVSYCNLLRQDTA